MSRSHKYHPFIHIARGRNRPYKKMANRKFRRYNKIILKINPSNLLYRLKECSNVWDFPTDGLAYYSDPSLWKRFKMWKDVDLKEIYRKIMKK